MFSLRSTFVFGACLVAASWCRADALVLKSSADSPRVQLQADIKVDSQADGTVVFGLRSSGIIRQGCHVASASVNVDFVVPSQNVTRVPIHADRWSLISARLSQPVFVDRTLEVADTQRYTVTDVSGLVRVIFDVSPELRTSVGSSNIEAIVGELAVLTTENEASQPRCEPSYSSARVDCGRQCEAPRVVKTFEYSCTTAGVTIRCECETPPPPQPPTNPNGSPCP